MQFTIDGKVLAKNILSWSKRKASVAADLHVLVVSSICHAVKHGDTTYINKLDEACRDGGDHRGKTASALHLSGMREFFVEYGPVKWVRADRKTNKPEHFAFVSTKGETLRDQYEANPDGFRDSLLSTPFWKLKSQKEFDGFNLVRVIMAAVSRADKIKEDDTKSSHPKNVIPSEMLDSIRAIAARFAPAKEAKATAN